MPILLWLLGIPIPLIILIMLLHHGLPPGAQRNDEASTGALRRCAHDAIATSRIAKFARSKLIRATLGR